jgi:chromate transporter
MSAPTDLAATAAPPGPTHAQLFVSFTKIALSGFGGTIAWAHREIVHQRRWMNEEEFTEMLSLSQFVPGPNIANIAIYVGGRFCGWTGALVAEIGLMTGPFLILCALGALYEKFGALPTVSGALSGISSAALGLLLAMGISMLKPFRKRPLDIAFILAAFLAVSLLGASLITTILILSPITTAIAWFRRQ